MTSLSELIIEILNSRRRIFSTFGYLLDKVHRADPEIPSSDVLKCLYDLSDDKCNGPLRRILIPHTGGYRYCVAERMPPGKGEKKTKVPKPSTISPEQLALNRAKTQAKREQARARERNVEDERLWDAFFEGNATRFIEQVHYGPCRLFWRMVVPPQLTHVMNRAEIRAMKRLMEEGRLVKDWRGCVVPTSRAERTPPAWFEETRPVPTASEGFDARLATLIAHLQDPTWSWADKVRLCHDFY